MTIQKSNDMKYVYTSFYSATPSPHMTNAQWQEKFQVMKQTVQPLKQRRITEKEALESLYPKKIFCDTHEQITDRQSYVMFINDTLSQLRAGAAAYAWFTYQIRDLLSFEHNRLCTHYFSEEQMWLIWLQ